MSARPFISYAREDQRVAVRLYGDLRAAGLRPWLDLVDLLPGQEWALEIRRAMKESSHVILLLSQYAVDKTGFVQAETRDALELAASYPPGKIFIVPARLDATVPKHEKLQQLHWVDLFPEYAVGVAKIIAALGVQPLSLVSSDVSEPEAEDPTEGTVLNEATLRAFLDTNGLSAYLDRKLANLTSIRAITELSPLSLPVEIDALNIVGICSIEQLERAMRQHRDAIVRWADEWLTGDHGPISKGTYLQYLGYILICQSGDIARLLQFLQAAHIGSAENREATATEIMAAYHKFGRKTA